MRRTAVSALLVLLGAFWTGSPAFASGAPNTAAGTYQIPAATDQVALVKVVGGNLFFQESAPLIYSGDISGSSLDVDSFVVHADGTFEGHGRETCAECTVGGRTGSYAAVFNFVGSGDDYTGNLTFLSGGEGLSGLHGGGVFTGTESSTGGTYSYHYSFST